MTQALRHLVYIWFAHILPLSVFFDPQKTQTVVTAIIITIYWVLKGIFQVKIVGSC